MLDGIEMVVEAGLTEATEMIDVEIMLIVHLYIIVELYVTEIMKMITELLEK
ncbi:hypothetical protein HOG21_03120 [bacterium]|jgi:hypothetical protein|nr:hypothetical protein [bacterium]